MCLLLGMYLFNNNNSFFEQRELLQQYNIGFEPALRNLSETFSTIVEKLMCLFNNISFCESQNYHNSTILVLNQFGEIFSKPLVL